MTDPLTRFIMFDDFCLRFVGYRTEFNCRYISQENYFRSGYEVQDLIVKNLDF